MRWAQIPAGGRRRFGFSTAVAGALAACLVIAAPAAATTDYTWTGTTPLSTSGASNWSNGANWGGTGPSGYSSVGTLSFPALPGCDQTVDACYTSYNDLLSLNANAITIDDGVPYDLPGIQHVYLGAGGLTAAPSASDTGSNSPIWNVPIGLTANQTWSITGGSSGQQLEIDSQVQGSSTLGIDLASGGYLDLAASDDVGAVGIDGDGAVVLGYPGQAAELNAISRSPATVSGGATLLTAAANDGSGPVTLTGGQLQLGFDGQAATLAAYGAVSFDSASAFSPFIAQPGTVVGADYSQVSATGAVDLGGAQLDVLGQNGPTGRCLQLNVGDVLDLITTTGSLTGTFSGVPDGATVPVDCDGGVGTPPTVRINYTSNAVTATVVTGGADGSSTTSLSHSPASPTTNQAVTLTASVSDPLAAPAGTVSFLNHGAPVAGCTHQPVVSSGSSYAATCQTSFAATSSPEALTADFTPSSSSLLASASAVDSVSVAKDQTNTVLTPPATAGTVGNTYTATVTAVHSGPLAPSGTVQFYNNGTPVGSCWTQSVTVGASALTATCAIQGTSAANNITATYSGDRNFAGSTSGALAPWDFRPPVINGWYPVGRWLGVYFGAWWGATPMAYSAQWQRCGTHGCVTIPGASRQDYQLSTADLGYGLRAVVQVTNSVGTATATSAEFGPVIGSRDQIKSSLAADLVPRGRAAKLGAVRRAKGYRLRVMGLEPGSAVIQWYAGEARSRLVLVAEGRVTFTAVGAKTMKITLTTAGKELLAGARGLKLLVKGTFVPHSFIVFGAVAPTTPTGPKRIAVQATVHLRP